MAAVTTPGCFKASPGYLEFPSLSTGKNGAKHANEGPTSQKTMLMPFFQNNVIPKAKCVFLNGSCSVEKRIPKCEGFVVEG